jgi:hypothetical protein
MIQAAMTDRAAIGPQLGYHHTVIIRLTQKYRETEGVKDRPRSGRPRVTS